jgi:hypothetical protein
MKQGNDVEKIKRQLENLKEKRKEIQNGQANDVIDRRTKRKR